MSVYPHTTGVLFAAGASSRMAGMHKLLLPYNGQTLVRHAATTMLEAGFAEVVVVLGREPENIKTALSGLALRFVQNEAYQSGMESSFRSAIGSLSANTQACVFALADMPLVNAAMLQALVQQHQNKNAPIVASRFAGTVAPPHLFAQEFFAVLGTPGFGAKPLMLQHQSRVVFVDQEPSALFDVDTAEDYAALLQHPKQAGTP